MSYGSVMGQAQDTSKIEQDIVNLQNDYVPKSGATMTGELNMGNNKISGVTNGVEANDVATVGQLDGAGWYPFKGSGLTLVGHYVGFAKAKTNVTLQSNFDYEKAFACAYICTSDSVMCSAGEMKRNSYSVELFTGVTETIVDNKTLAQKATVQIHYNNYVYLYCQSDSYYDVYIYVK